MNNKSGKSVTNSFGAGMNFDLDTSLLKDNQYRYAENIRLISNEGATTGAISNIQGFTRLTDIGFDTDEVVVGTATVRDFGVIFTKYIVDTVSYNQIYKLVFDSDITYTKYPILSTTAGDEISLGITELTKLSMVTRYEDDDNIKVYWADSVNPIRSINIATANQVIYSADELNIIPSAELNQPIIHSLGSGKLNSGLIQYTYQMSALAGSETGLAPISNTVHLTASNTDNYSINYLGTGLGEVYGMPSGKSVKVSIGLPTNNIFTKLKLISIYYYDYNITPIVNIVKEIDITGMTGDVVLEDGGVSVVGEMTHGELNILGVNAFVPKLIESSNNMLFAANIAETSFDVPDTLYDTRAFQFKYISNTTDPESPAELSFEVLEAEVDETSYTNPESPYEVELLLTSFDDPYVINVYYSGETSLDGVISTGDTILFYGAAPETFPTHPIEVVDVLYISAGNSKILFSLPLIDDMDPATLLLYQDYPIIIKEKYQTITTSTKTGKLLLNNTYGGLLSSHIEDTFFIRKIQGHVVDPVHIDIIADLDSSITIDFEYNGINTGDIIEIWEPRQSIVDQTVKLYKADGSFDLYSISGAVYPEIVEVPLEHDCIHDEIYSVDRYADLEYIYNMDGDLGGTGVNVSYLFTNAYFVESYGNYWNKDMTVEANRYIDQRTARIGDIKRTLTGISTKNSNGDNEFTPLTDLGISNHEGQLNYANPLLAGKLKSYQRDEIYRFAIVYHNSKGQRSQAHWIADVRFPAGYYKDDNWSSSIFEMPTEVILGAGIDNNSEDTQELLVKPLGIKFTFSNLDLIKGAGLDVSKIEIVRAKRDINNKTILAQGVIQKTGTYRDEPLIDAGRVNSLRPHSIVSMGDTYSVTAPYHEVTNQNLFECPYGSSWITFHYKYKSFLSPSPYSNIDYAAIHASSPYFANKNSFLFINPETSYYGIDFTQQLKNTFGSIKLDMVDLIFPVTTPPITGLAASSWGSAYYGSTYHNRMQFLPNRATNSIKYPTGMYAAADITTNSYDYDKNVADSTTLITNGFVSAYANNIENPSTIGNLYEASDVDGYDLFDIYPQKKPEVSYFNEIGKRIFISLGGWLHGDLYNDGNYNSGLYGGVSEANVVAPISVTTASESSRNAITFKYFCRFDKLIGTDTFGGESITFAYRSSDSNASATTTQIPSMQSNKVVISSGKMNTNLIKNIDSFEYAGDIDDTLSISNLSPSKYVSIGSSSYLNFSKPLTDGDLRWRHTLPEGPELYARNVASMSKSKAAGPHGSGMLLYMDTLEQIPSIVKVTQTRKKYLPGGLYAGYKNIDDMISAGMGTYICNLKVPNSYIYGGSSLLDRQFTEYISTGTYIDMDNNNSSESPLVFGGDTFIGIFDYTITRASDPKIPNYSDANTYDWEVILANQEKQIGGLFPLESSINMHLSSSKSFVASGYKLGLQKEPGAYMPGLSTGCTWTNTQLLPEFNYNAAYSSNLVGLIYNTNLIGAETNNSFDVRVYNSEAKTNDEVYDSWATFKPANYIDVDSEYGELTGLKKFNNKLFFWQKNAFGQLSVNERALIKDNNFDELVLGAGGILSRFDYISTNNGFRSGIIGGIVKSEGAIYWYDHDRAEFCSYDNSINSVSKANGIQSVLNSSKSDIISDGISVPMVYDKKYNEIIVSLYGLKDLNATV